MLAHLNSFKGELSVAAVERLLIEQPHRVQVQVRDYFDGQKICWRSRQILIFCFRTRLAQEGQQKFGMIISRYSGNFWAFQLQYLLDKY